LEQLLANTLANVTAPSGAAASRGAAKPRVVTFFSNGSFDGIIGKYVEAAR
jgi:hypothetical protein